jgi:DNA-directed RNA polymerase specialized sigma24 family protein
MTAAPTATRTVRRSSSATRLGELADVHRQALRLARARWPEFEADDLARRAMKRYERRAGPDGRPDNITVWLRSTIYQLVVDDQRADRGERQHDGELSMLLRQLVRPPAEQIRPDLVRRAVAHLHNRDLHVLRLQLLGFCTDEIALRHGMSGAQVDQAYRRSRRRLRAAIEHDPQLLHGLRALIAPSHGRPTFWLRRVRQSRHATN